MTNLFYFKKLCPIGGTEQFLFEIAKKYHRYCDITVLYDEADVDQLLRLRALVRCIKREVGETYKAERAFFNFNLDAIDQVEAPEKIFVCHANFEEIGYKPPINHPKLTGIIAVSEFAKRKAIEYQQRLHGRPLTVERIYNPITLEKVRPVMRVVSATRLDDPVKGGKRTLKLIEALDAYSEKTGKPYLWIIFSNEPSVRIKSPNVVVLPGRLNIRPYIADADWLVQLSNDMETYCYSINEALGYGTRIVRTPLSVAEELHIPESAEIVADWDMGNIEEVAKEMFEREWASFSYRPPADGWKKWLVKAPSTYTPKPHIFIRPTTHFYDLEKGEEVDRFRTEPYEVSVERARELVKKGLAEIVKG